MTTISPGEVPLKKVLGAEVGRDRTRSRWLRRLGAKIPHEPYVVQRWRREHPGQDIPDGTSSPSRGRPGPTEAAATRSFTTSTGTTGPAARAIAPR